MFPRPPTDDAHALADALALALAWMQNTWRVLYGFCLHVLC